MPTSLYVYNKKETRLQHINFFIGGRTWYFVLNVIICLFLGGGIVIFRFFSCNLTIIYCLNMYKLTDLFRILYDLHLY